LAVAQEIQDTHREADSTHREAPESQDTRQEEAANQEAYQERSDRRQRLEAAPGIRDTRPGADSSREEILESLQAAADDLRPEDSRNPARPGNSIPEVPKSERPDAAEFREVRSAAGLAAE
jgi:hypothetical protein